MGNTNVDFVTRNEVKLTLEACNHNAHNSHALMSQVGKEVNGQGGRGVTNMGKEMHLVERKQSGFRRGKNA